MDTYEEAKFVVNLNRVKNVIATSKRLIQDIAGSKLYYSLKAQNDMAIVKEISKYIDGFDISSINEYFYIKKLGLNNSLSITGSSFTYKDIETLYLNGEKYMFDSIDLLSKFIRRNSKRQLTEIGIRVAYNYYGRIFGININEDVINLLKENINISLTTLHIHFGEKQNPLIIEEALSNILQTAEYLKSNNLLVPNEINLGGGLDELFRSKSVDRYFSAIKKFIYDYSKISKQSVRIIFEPGELIAKSLADLEVSIIDIKKVNDFYQIVVNASKFNLLPWDSPQLFKEKNNIDSKLEKIKVFGFTNFSGDFFGEFYIPINDIYCGKRLIFKNIGAYSKGMERHLQMIDPPKTIYIG